MKVYFTSDTHFNHANIIKYCNRPFYKEGDLVGGGELAVRVWKSDKIKSDRCNWMNEVLIENWNDTVKPEDVVYHLGDFGFLNTEEYSEYLNKLNGHIILFRGNHDEQNKVKAYLTMAIMNFGGKEVFAQHHPPEELPICDFAICGHVHDKWKHRIYKKHPNIPIINLSVDVWDYRPISTETLLKYYGLVKNGYVNEMGERI